MKKMVVVILGFMLLAGACKKELETYKADQRHTMLTDSAMTALDSSTHPEVMALSKSDVSEIIGNPEKARARILVESSISCSYRISHLILLLAYLGQDYEPCDYNFNGIVDISDLMMLLNCLGHEPLDIIIRWQNFYNDAQSGYDGFELYPTIKDTSIEWSDIAANCQVTWSLDGNTLWTGTDIQFIDASPVYLCDGNFPLQVEIKYMGNTYIRKEPSRLGIAWDDNQGNQIADCDYGISIMEVDQAGMDMSPYWTPDSEVEDYQYCIDCCN